MNVFLRALSLAVLAAASASGQICVQETLDCNQPVPTIFKLGDASCACNSPDHAGALKYDSGKMSLCLGSEWKTLQFQEAYGTENNPGLSCIDILNKAGQQLSNGTYWIRLLAARRAAFPVYCDMAAGGWTMVFKAVSGVNKNVYNTFTSDQTSSEEVLAALDVTNKHLNHYKNRIVLNWRDFGASEARVVLYKGGQAIKELKFDAQGSDNLNWFSFNRLTQSPWSDINTQPKNYFDILGAHNRNFFINRNYGGCHADSGWLVITGQDCEWERHYARKVAILYSKLSGYTNWNHYNNIGEADVLAVYLR